MFNYIKSLSGAQQLYLGTLALTLSGSALAYRYMPQVASFVDQNKTAVGALALLSAAPVVSPLLMRGYAMLPSFAQLPSPLGAIHMNGMHMNGMHMNGLHMGALAMQKNPLMVSNPLSFAGVHAMNGMHV